MYHYYLNRITFSRLNGSICDTLSKKAKSLSDPYLPASASETSFGISVLNFYRSIVYFKYFNFSVYRFEYAKKNKQIFQTDLKCQWYFVCNFKIKTLAIHRTVLQSVNLCVIFQEFQFWGNWNAWLLCVDYGYRCQLNCKNNYIYYNAKVETVEQQQIMMLA